MARKKAEAQAGPEFKRMRVRVTFVKPVLGTAPGDADLYRRFIASKAPDAEKVEDQVAAVGVEEVVELGKTFFPKLEDGTPILWAYQVKGFFKEACRMLKKVAGTESSKIFSYKKDIDGLIFPEGDEELEDAIRIDMHGLHFKEVQRPLRADTPKGERVSIACSEMIPAGATAEFTVGFYEVAGNKYSLEKAILEWLSYGRKKGLLQWRNGGMGKFSTEIIDLETGEATPIS